MYRFEASMGPHFFKCGKLDQLQAWLDPPQASMGPHFFKCGKKKAKAPVVLLDTSFNGAALFQVRKGDELSYYRAKGFCFNGAALFQVRKEVIEGITKSRGSSFNGAALFQVRKAFRILALRFCSM